MAETKDRRAADRLAVNATTACGFVGPVAEDFGPGKIRDVSLDGIGIILFRTIAVGTLLTVTLTNPQQKFSKTVLVRVAHITAAHGGYLVGGTFTEPLTYQEFTTLVM